MGKTSLVKSFSNLKKWVSSHKWETFLLISILLIGSILRLYKIDEYLTFLGDEGRDVIIVRRLLVNGDPILVGPGTSIGNMYLGPLYYYMIAPALLIANFSPVGPAVLIALIGVLTIWFIWFIGREWFGKWAGLIAALLYAVSPTVIIYSRASWNPNIMPFFALLSIYSIWRVWRESEWKWLLILGIGVAFALNSHYLGLLLFPPLGFIWLLKYLELRKVKNEIRGFWKYSILGGAIFLFLMSPLVIFDARHEWRNFKSMEVFFTERQTTVSARPWNSLTKIWPLTQKISTRLIAGRNPFVGTWVAIAMSAVLLWLAGLYRSNLAKKERLAYILLILWLGTALVGLGLYKQEIYDHYYGFFFPAPFLLIGGMLQHIIQRHKLRGWWITFTALLFLVFINFEENPLKYPSNKQLQRSVAVAQKIREEAKEEPFNFAVIAERNYEGAYQYFFEKDNDPFVMIDPQRADETITDQLFVVCELPIEKCDPTHNAKAEVANFGWSKIEASWEVMGVIIFKLAHSQ